MTCFGMCSDKEDGTEGVPADVEDECDEVCIDFDPYTFIKNLPPLKQVVPRWRRSLLPRQTRQCKRKTLVRRLASLAPSPLYIIEPPTFCQNSPPCFLEVNIMMHSECLLDVRYDL